MRRCLVLILFLSVPLLAAASDPRDFFETKVRPLLAANCLACHTATKMGGLEMRSREAFLKGGNSGPAIVPGDPDRSLLIRAVRHQHERIKMPPAKKLSDAEIDILATWIRDGARWPESAPAGVTAGGRDFWSLQPVRKPAPPRGKNGRWAKSPVDRFLLAKLEARGLQPAPPADRRTLLRRATYDLTGLPPTPEEYDRFLNDQSPGAFANVVDRLLASPRYGERWGRHWLDVARYSDDKLDPTGETPHPNSFRYRNWVIQAFNDDMPYDVFIKAQIAGDLLPHQEKTVAGLGLYALSPEFQDDRVDVTTRGFLGLTVACAQCHDHKYDPIPQKDYYALLGVFANTRLQEYPLAPAAVVNDWKGRKKRVDDQQKAIKDFADNQGSQLALIFAGRIAEYLEASRAVSVGEHKTAQQAGEDAALDREILDRLIKYRKEPRKDHPFLRRWEKEPSEAAAQEFQAALVAVYHEKNEIDRKNVIRLGGSMERRDLSQANLLSLDRDRFGLWRAFFGRGGVLHFTEQSLAKYLQGEWKAHLERMQAELARLKKELPEQYPFLQVVADTDKPVKQRLYIRGDRNNPGEEVPQRFLTVLCDGKPKPFLHGSGRLELAEAIADAGNPLTARVVVNRIWLGHFGQGIVRTPSNFGRLGDRPSHPELLDYLAARFIEAGWSIKAMHREIMLSAAYQMSSVPSRRGIEIDPDNRLLGRFNRRRLDAEAVRDSLLFVSGELDLAPGGKAERLSEKNRKRTVYSYISRKKLDPMLALFDFPNPNNTSEQRITTTVPLQSLFFLNSPLVLSQAEALAKRVRGPGTRESVRKAYRILFGRAPAAAELKAGEEFVKDDPDKNWPLYLQVLLSSNEFLFVG
ncbi:MAG: PSD1 domain-containing protein [Acidobacteria bacterium]|nr:PSD1 domain-containing protein [Acidobacteriota bacterium]